MAMLVHPIICLVGGLTKESSDHFLWKGHDPVKMELPANHLDVERLACSFDLVLLRLVKRPLTRTETTEI